ncbi:hypothetical protein [Dapis sp. BLCC M229]
MYSSQGATEKVQKSRIEYLEKVKDIDLKNLVFLENACKIKY